MWQYPISLWILRCSTSSFHYPLRVRIGLHWCQDVAAQRDRIHGRYDYYGHDVNVCARVEAQASGGQIMVTAETMKAIMDTEVYPLIIAPDTITAIVKRHVELKGVSECVNLYAMAPTSQVESGYISPKHVEELPGLIVIGTGSINYETASTRSQETSESVQFSDRASVALSQRSGNGIWSGLSATRNEKINTDQNVSIQFSSALFRATFKAVPDNSKALWLKALARKLNVVLAVSEVVDTSSERQTRRIEQFKHFESLQVAMEDCCLRAHVSEASHNHEDPSFPDGEASLSTLGVRSVLSEH